MRNHHTSSTPATTRPDRGTPLVLTSKVFQDARTFFEDRGAFGLEGTAMIKKDTGLELVIPRQNAHRDDWGNVNVEVPREGQMDLALALGPDDLYVARIHSHPGAAFHSAADDANPIISFEGGISIVVPFFGLGLRHGLDACAVYHFSDGYWGELKVGSDRDRWIVGEESS